MDRRRKSTTPTRPILASARCGAEAPLDQLAQRGERQVRGVDDQVGGSREAGRSAPARAAMPSLTRPCGASGMAAAGFGVAAQQRGLVGPGEDQLGPQAEVGAQAFRACEHERRRRNRGCGHRRRRRSGRGASPPETSSSSRSSGGLSTASIAEVLERAQDRGLAAARQAGDQDDPGARCRRCSCARRLRRPA